jgi:xanthine dehydrogenase iron-sulfur cluster and FAD-binding subunit A
VSLPEAVSLRHQHPEAVVVAGATDVALRVTKGHELLPCILDCSNIQELKTVRQEGGVFAIGAGVSLETFTGLAAVDFPAFASMLSVFGSQQIRSMGTLAGNLATASPIGDMIPVLIAHGASVALESLNGRRTLPVESFLTGYRTTALRRDELITAILLPRPAGVVRAYKVSKRRDLDIATMSAAFRLVLSPGGAVEALDAVYGGMDSRVRRAASVERFLPGKPWTRTTVEEASRLLDTEFRPLSDVRGSAAFRSAAARNVLIKFWSETQHNER